MPKKRVVSFALILFCAFVFVAGLCLFQIYASGDPAPDSVNLKKISWLEKTGCSKSKSSGISYPKDNWLSTLKDKSATLFQPPLPVTAKCISHTINPESPYLELEYAGNPKRNETYILINQNGIHKKINLDAVYHPAYYSKWKRLYIRLDSGNWESPLIISLIDKNTDDAHWIALRSKANFYQYKSRWKKSFLNLKNKLLSTLPLWLICFLCAACILLAYRYFIQNEISAFSFFILLFLTSLGVHFRQNTFYYWDAWHILNRFMHFGISGIIYTHNEHFLPFFWLYYYGICKLLGTSYAYLLVFSSLIHSLNALLLAVLCQKSLKHILPDNRKISRFLAFFFVISSLHTEVMHWAFEQTVLLSNTMIFSCLILVMNYLESGKMLMLLGIMLSAFTAPLFFGGGFTLAFYSVILLCFYSLTRGFNFSKFKDSLLALLSVAMGLGATAIIYLNYVRSPTSSMPAMDFGTLLLYLKEPLKYIVVGSQLGTVLRGLGFYPGLEFGGCRRLAGIDSPEALNSLRFGDTLDPETLAVLTGCILSLVFLLALLKFFHWQAKGFYLWCLSEATIVSSLLLPAFGRWQLGLGQSLSLRYHYVPVAALCLLLIPLINSLIFTNRKQLKSISAIGFALLLTALQLYQGAKFTYFTEKGAENRRYLLQIQNLQGLYDNKDSLGPLEPESLTPGLDISAIQSILQWLSNSP